MEMEREGKGKAERSEERRAERRDSRESPPKNNGRQAG